MHRSLRNAPTLLPTSVSRGGAPAPSRYSRELLKLLSTLLLATDARHELSEICQDTPQAILHTSLPQFPAHCCTKTDAPLLQPRSQVYKKAAADDGAPKRAARRTNSTRSMCHPEHRGAILQKKFVCEPVCALSILTTDTPARAQQHKRTHARAWRRNHQSMRARETPPLAYNIQHLHSMQHTHEHPQD